MIEEPPTVIAAIFLLFLIACNIYGCGKVDIEKQAINRGYATYDNNGVFQWKEQQK